MIPGAFPIVAGASRYRAKGISFDGSSYLERSSNFSGIADGRTGTLSFWIRFSNAADDGKSFVIMFSGSSRIVFTRNSSNLISLNLLASNDVTLFSFRNTTQILSDSTWHHIITSWDVNAFGNLRLYVDGVDDLNPAVSGSTSRDIDYTDAPFRIGKLTPGWSGSSPLKGDLAEYWFAPTYIDVSVAANLAKFRSTSGRPAFPGVDGSLPTGSPPTIYVTGPASTVTTNKGAGGDFTMSGALTDASTSPSD